MLIFIRACKQGNKQINTHIIPTKNTINLHSKYHIKTQKNQTTKKLKIAQKNAQKNTHKTHTKRKQKHKISNTKTHKTFILTNKTKQTNHKRHKNTQKQTTQKNSKTDTKLKKKNTQNKPKLHKIT